MKGLEGCSAVDVAEEVIEKSKENVYMVMRVIVDIEGAISKWFLKSSWQLPFALR